MKEESGALSQQERDKIKDWLIEKGADGDCDVCGHKSWIVGNHLIRLEIFTPGKKYKLGGEAYPMAFVMCENCYQMRTFAAKPIGIDLDGEDSQDG